MSRPQVSAPRLELKEGDSTLSRIVLDLFMREIKRLKPEVIREFAESVPSAVGESGWEIAVKADPEERVGPYLLSPELKAWAEKWNLRPASSVFPWAFRTLPEWRRYPERRAGLDWTTDVYTAAAFTPSIHSEYPSIESLKRRPPIEPLEAFTDLETLEAFRTRAEHHWLARDEALRQRNELGPVGHATARHLAWLVRFQVAGESFSHIARAERIKRQETVATGVKAAARILRLNIRNAHPGGRPRNTRAV